MFSDRFLLCCHLALVPFYLVTNYQVFQIIILYYITKKWIWFLMFNDLVPFGFVLCTAE